jgi:cytochrome c oxidase accessory protein FixG
MVGAARAWVYTHTIDGRFQRVHRASGVVLQAFFLLVPWLSWNGHPMARFDLPGRRFTVVGTTFTAEDTIFIVLMLLLAAFGLFLVTSVLGRIWCGWACPQTVFLEEWVRPIEHLVEGERGERIRRDQGPWTVDRAWRKALKFALFGVAAAGVGFSFASWFNDPLLLWSGRAGVGAEGFALLVSTLVFLDFAWFREQFCNYLCPYARFQGALTDEDSLVVAYDAARGEPRRAGKVGPGGGSLAARAGSARGACIDCKKCVVVCPAGIDIREGFQLECIACARCVDACEDVMGKYDAPSLIRYSSQRAEAEAKSTGAPAAFRFRRVLRPRVLVYAGLVSLVSATFVGMAYAHRPVELNVNRAPGSLYVKDPDGSIRNTFLVRVGNNELDPAGEDYRLEVAGLPEGTEVIRIPLHVGPAAAATVPLVVRVPADHAARTIPFTVTVRGQDAEHTTHVDATFKGEGP